MRISLTMLFLIAVGQVLQAQWVDWSNQYPYPGHRVYSHTMHRTSDGNLLLCASIHGGWTPGSGIPFEDWSIATYLVKTLPTGDTLWTLRIDSIKPSYISHVVDLIDGNTLIAGTAAAPWTYCGFANANGPMPQLFALKIDQAGNVLWWHQYDQPCSRILADAWETPSQEIHLLALDTQEPNIVIGYVQPNWFEHHTLDAQGSTIGVTTFQQTHHYYTSQAGTASFDGGRYIAASALDTVGQNNLFVQLEKVSSSGAPQSAVFITDTSYCTPVDLIATLDSGLLMLLAPDVARSRLVHLDTLGTVLWDRTYAAGFRELLALPDSTYLAVGSHGTFQSPGMSELCVTLISSTGDSLWSRLYGDSLTDRGWSIAEATGGFLAYGTKDMYSGSVPPRLFLTWDTLGVFLSTQATEAKQHSLIVYPNPATDQVVVELETNRSKLISVVVFDGRGRMVHQSIPDGGVSRWVIDTSSWPTGCYLVRTLTDQGQAVGRLLIMDH